MQGLAKGHFRVPPNVFPQKVDEEESMWTIKV
jgi:hypothetical protein